MEGTCAGCKGGFKAGDQVLSALDQKWHPQHFTCSCMAPSRPCSFNLFILERERY